MNTLEIFKNKNDNTWVAFFTGETGFGEKVFEEEANNIHAKTEGDAKELCLLIFGVSKEETNIIVFQ
ncbi:hypothetical protein P7M03_16680 [Vibrio parahaemolyticus]|nr:hypothetical protein [Vibrio parahaemolyticus]